MDKKVRKRLGNTYYLLGTNENGDEYYWKKPTWDCDWYWSVDWLDCLDTCHHTFISQYGINLFIEGYQKPFLIDTPFTEKEKWKLVELFRSIHLMQQTAEFFVRGSSGISELKGYKNENLAKEINENTIPQLIKDIEEIVKPS